MRGSDPMIAKMVGFDRPILHGMCSYGIIAREIISRYCSGQVDRLVHIQARFAKPVHPGDTIYLCSKLVKPTVVLFTVCLNDSTQLVTNGVATLTTTNGRSKI